MEVLLFSMLEDRKKLRKSNYIQLASCDFKIEQDCSILKPMLYIGKEKCPDYYRVNYCYVPAWSRYYFVDDVTACKGGLLQFDCTVDVLNTYVNSIAGITTLIDRQENRKNMAINDSEFLTNNNRDIVYKAFTSSVFSAGSMSDGVNCIALTVTGGNV